MSTFIFMAILIAANAEDGQAEPLLDIKTPFGARKGKFARKVYGLVSHPEVGCLVSFVLVAIRLV